MEIFGLVLPGLDRGSSSADRLIAAFEERQRSARLRVCSSCGGDYEDPDRTAWNDGPGDDDRDEDSGEAPSPDDDLLVPRQ